MKQLLIILALFTTVAIFTDAKAGDSNTVSSTVVTNNTPPTANSQSSSLLSMSAPKIKVSPSSIFVAIAGVIESP